MPCHLGRKYEHTKTDSEENISLFLSLAGVTSCHHVCTSLTRASSSQTVAKPVQSLQGTRIDNDSDDNGILASITLPSADGIKCDYHLPLFIYLSYSG